MPYRVQTRKHESESAIISELMITNVESNTSLLAQRERRERSTREEEHRGYCPHGRVGSRRVRVSHHNLRLKNNGCVHIQASCLDGSGEACSRERV